VLQEAIHYSFINLCIYSFSLWYKFFVHLESRKKIINMVLIRDRWNFSFFSRGDVSPTHSNSVALFRGHRQNTVSSSVIILLKKFCLHPPSPRLGKM
jgi:hypothetical protein